MHAAVPSIPALPCHPLAALRQATRAQHARIDALMDLARLGERPHYGRVLQVFAAFLAGWEPAAAAALPPGWSAWLRARSGILQPATGGLGRDSHPPLAPAPGTYVFER